VARAVAGQPSILLADEPTGNLDSTNGRHVIELLGDINRTRGTTLMLVTHDPELAGCTDVTLTMRDGRTERTATPAAALEPAGAAAG
jgi:ABC-type lipoprotein export system ATPase subunit